MGLKERERELQRRDRRSTMAALERETGMESTAVPLDATEIQSGDAWCIGDHQEGQNFYITKIEELCADQTSVVSNGQSDDIVMFLHCSKVLSEHMGMSTKILSLLQLKERSFFTTPLIIKDDICIGNTRQFDLFYEYSNNDCEVAPVEIEEESSMLGIIKELGYGSTVDTTHCKDLLSLFLPLNEVTLSKLVGTIARTRTGLENTKSEHLKFCSALDIHLIDPSLLTTWNIDVLVESIKLLAPETNWTNVMENLDHEGFNIADEKAFSLLMSIYVKACQDPFPLHAICGSVWNNAEGQLSFLRHAVVASPDIFTFAHCSRKTYMDKLPSNEHGNQAWSCLDLLEVLCLLAERGFVSSVQLMLEYPINRCPVVLLVGIAQINTAYNLLQHEVASIIFPTILKDSAESSIMQHLWHVNKNLVLRGFLDAHTDPNNIFQNLNICQELKPSESSLQLMSSSSQFAQQLSPFQLQQRHQGLLGNGLKTTVTSANYAKTVSSHAGKSSLVCAPVDSVICQQANVSQPLQTRSSQQSASVTSGVSFSHGFLHPSRSITTAGFGLALNIDTLVTAAERRHTPIENPAPEVQDKILFMINNISNANIDTKAKEFIEVLQEQYYPWFAQYMVMRRASIEPNFHDLYLKFLDKVNHKSLNKEILKATYENCKVLLRSDLIKSSSEERSLLKNLGSLLGKLTIGRNQPLRAKELDPKVLIVEAYEKGLMIAVIPFTSKILEPCRCSIVYQPPNPWTMGILGLLTEIYNLPNLKMNLKFDIEVLLKNFSMDMKDAKPSSLLKDLVRELEGNPDFSCKNATAPQLPVLPDANSGIMPTLNQVELQPDVNNISHLSTHANHSASLHLASNAMAGDGNVEALIIPEPIPSTQSLSRFTPSDTPFCASQLLTIIPNSDYYVNINQKLSSMYPKMEFYSIVQVALGQAIKDMAPRILHLVSIAWKTTKELVWKDYAMELDYSVIHRAARSMVKFLATNMAHVNCKEPFRDALLNHLQSVFQTLNVNKECSEQIVPILTTDHLDLGGEVIINIALEKAVELIDGELGSFFASMRKQIELSGYAYYVTGTYAQGPFSYLPEALRPNPGHLSMAQQRVYEDFNMNLWKPSHNSDVVPAGPHGINSSSVSSAASHLYGSSTGQLSSSIFPTSHVAPGISAVPRQLDPVLEDCISGSTQLLSVPSTHVFINGVMKPNAEISSTTATSAAVSFAESHVMEEVGAGLPSSSWSERLGIAMPGSLLSPGDALDKYEQLEKMVCLWFDNWLEICENPNVNNAACSHISQLQQNGWLKGDDVTDQIFHILTVHSVGRCVAIEHVTNPDSLSLQSTQQRQLSFSAIDAYAKLVIFVLKHCFVDHESSEPILLSKILSVTVRVIQKEANDKTSSFNPRPYFRLFINWLLDLTSADPALNGVNFQVLTLFANAFHALQPLKVPGWSFVWLELLSHRSFMPKLLTTNTKEGWRWFHCLLVDLFKFMQPYLRSVHKIGEPVQFFYKGTLKVLLVLLHDFPEFLCEYHFSFCDLIPPHCIQMRNIILSSFPCNMRVPNPSEPNLKIDLLPETSQSPCILSDVDGALKAKQIKADIDEFLKTRLEEPFLSELMQRLLLPQSEANLNGTYYNVPLINSLVLFVGMQAIQQLESMPSPVRDILQVRPHVDILESLVENLDTEGRYHVLNAVANQLRYPNTHTHYFSFILLHLFARGSQEMVREQITRVLLERLIPRPHPWGVVITFIELIKNPQYEFWSRPFVRCTPGIKELLYAAAAQVSV